MKTIELIRLETDIHQGTRGALRVGKELFGVTLEPPWKMNERNVSCIPAGQYKIHSWESARFGKCYSLLDVPGRTNILFHAGNTVRDTTGCILLGEKWGFLNGERAILHSRHAVASFLEFMGNDISAHLTIMEVY